MVRYKISCTLTGEQLFMVLAKQLNIQDMHIQELDPGFTTTPEMEAKLKPTKLEPIKPQPPAKKLRKYTRLTTLRGPNLDAGLNGVIVKALLTGPRRPAELEKLAEADNYSKASISSRMVYLHGLNVIEPVGDGTWRIKDAPTKAKDAPRAAPNSGAEHNESQEVAELERH